MNGARIAISAIVGSALIAGIALYYLQVYAFYDEVTDGVIELTPVTSEVAEPILFADFQAIDADSSPLRYRACFTTQMSEAMLTETYKVYDAAEPRVAPDWFECFEADEIGVALEGGRATAYLGEENVQYGIDRVVGIMSDGRGFVWHQINDCGEVVFDGRRAPEGCPTPPETLQ
jgi:hypothetical protein